MKRFLLIFLIFSPFFASAQSVGGDREPQPDVLVMSIVEEVSLVPTILEVQVILSEAQSNGKITLEELQTRLATALTDAGIDMQKSLQVVKHTMTARKRDAGTGYTEYLLTLSSPAQLHSAFAQFAAQGIHDATLRRTDIDSMNVVRADLCAKAMQTAKRTADAMAAATGQQVSKAIRINTSIGSGSGGEYYTSPMVLRGSSSFMEESAVPQLPDNLEVKPIKVSQRVDVTFELK